MGDDGTGTRGTRLLFVCTGNTCRSPMAEVLARRRAEERGLAVEVRSAGTAAMAGGEPSRGAWLAAREADLDLSGHTSSRLTEELAEWADLVVCMTFHHREAAAELAGTTDGIFLLTEFLPGEHPDHGDDVPDPVGRSLEVYRETLALIDTALEGLLDRVAASGRGG